MMISRDTSIKILKFLVLLSAAKFVYIFFKDSYEELFLNPVHFFEDAYMFIRYAKIWHLGYGESWNIGEGHVYGNTSQLHFLFVLLLTSLPSLSDDAIIKISSFVPAFIFMAWLPWFCARHSTLFVSQQPWQKYLLWLGIICPLVYSFTAFAYHDLTGMDTSLSILMHLLLIDAVLTYANISTAGYSISKKMAGHFVYFIVALIYLAFLTRPENILACTLFVLLYFVFILKDIPATKKMLLCLSLIVIIDSLVKYFYFGDFLPLAVYAKRAGYVKGNLGAGFSHPAFYFFYFLSTIIVFIFVQLYAMRKNNVIKQLVFIIPAVLTISYFFSMMTMMNMKGRYFYPFTPYFIAAAITSFGPTTFQLHNYVKNIGFLIGFVCVSIAVTVANQHSGDIVNALLGDQELCDDSLKTPAANFGGSGYRVDTDGFKHLVAALKDIAPGLRIAMTENGYIGSQLPRVAIIDITGLHNPAVAHAGFSAQWLFDQQPDMIWMPHWHYTCMTHDILYNDTFWRQYRFYPGLFTWGVALRKGSPYYQSLLNSFNTQVESIYPDMHLSDFEKSRN